MVEIQYVTTVTIQNCQSQYCSYSA